MHVQRHRAQYNEDHVLPVAQAEDFLRVHAEQLFLSLRVSQLRTDAAATAAAVAPRRGSFPLATTSGLPTGLPVASRRINCSLIRAYRTRRSRRLFKTGIQTDTEITHEGTHSDTKTILFLWISNGILFRDPRTDTMTSNKSPSIFRRSRQQSWAVSTIMTRQNLIPSEDGSRMIHALIPMWDMCNHVNGRITTDFNATTNCCECYALRNFKKGEQIFISYGPRTNSDFFVHSGFVYMDNKEDGFKLRLGISKADSLQRERIELLNKLDLPSMSEFLLKPGTEPISDLLLAFLRVFSMRKQELTHWLRSDRVNDLKHMDCALETVVEENVRKFLLTRLQLLIANYPTTLKEDLQLLETSLPQIKKLAIQLRVTEKKILLAALEYVEQWIKA
ncbi:SET domain containing 3 isoform X2 [Megalopta genalis]|uniref:SET domain containing 3 isoform X2 n=1 Tax=Megalopta genalis TaxID=115081 RepID=UPI003FD5C4D7